MANAKRGEIPIKLRGKDLILRIDFNALSELDDMLAPLNQSTQSILSNTSMLMSAGFLRRALLVGLRCNPNGNKLTLDKIGKVLGKEIAEGNYAYVVTQVTKALLCAFGIDSSKMDEVLGEENENSEAANDTDPFDGPAVPTDPLSSVPSSIGTN